MKKEMNRKNAPPALMALFAAAVLSACAGTPPPQWAESLEAAFPADRYIAVRGASGSRETVKEAALRELSLYFRTQVSSRTELAESYREQDGAASQSLQLEQQTLIQTETELFAVRYTDPWQNPAAGTWEAAAYIDRAEAWTIFEPRLSSRAMPFMALFRAAEGDGEPLRRFFRYKAAAASVAALPAYLDFAQTLHPLRAAAFAPARAATAALPQRINQAKFDASVYVDCPVDLDGGVAAALTSALSAEGLPVTKDRAAASAVCQALVDEGMEKREAGAFYTPVLTIVITGRTGAALFSLTLTAPRQSAVNPDIARRRAYTALAGDIQNKLPLNKQEEIYEQAD